MCDGGRVIFGHTRVGYQGRLFSCYKFRSMCIDADQVLEDYLANNKQASEEWKKYHKLRNDPRITKIGKFLRCTRLDEIPQFFNLIKGDMSLVGPRPVTLYELDVHYKSSAAYYLSVVPGIFGLWQVSGRQMKYEERVQTDVNYIKCWSLFKDIAILFAAIPILLKSLGR